MLHCLLLYLCWNYIHVQATEQGFFSFVYICIGVWDQVIKGGCCDPTNRFNSATLCAYPSQARTWLSNGIYHGPLCVQWAQLRGEVIIRLSDIVEIDYHPSLFKLFFSQLYKTTAKHINYIYLLCHHTSVVYGWNLFSSIQASLIHGYYVVFFATGNCLIVKLEAWNTTMWAIMTSFLYF